jgi:hypothetical protein
VLVTASTLPAAGTGGARALRAPLATAGAALAATTYVGLIDPNQSGHYPTCPFLFITGYYCPGCGSLRAVHALTHGDVGAAVGLNVLTVVGIVAATVVWGRWMLRAWRGQPRTRVAPAWTIYLVLGVVVVFWIVRNLTMGEALAP